MKAKIGQIGRTFEPGDMPPELDGTPEYELLFERCTTVSAYLATIAVPGAAKETSHEQDQLFRR